MSIHFISDLHLHEDRPLITEAFFSFLQRHFIDATPAPNEPRQLYILGDLFDAWIGDDDDSALAQTTLDKLRETSNTNTELFFMAGNRDFLAGSDFASHTGCTLLDDPTVITLAGKEVLLMHGDTLCTEDHDYQKFRNVVRSREWQQEVLGKSLAERRALAQALRNDSQQANAEKDNAIMDVNAAEVVRSMEQYGVQTLIHGHTHRPACHDLTVNGQPAQRIVLGDWDQWGWHITLCNQQPTLQRFSLDAR